MEKLTQTRPDNCWQTCIAMLLGCPAESLPAQHEFAERDDYGRALRVCLDKHYGVTYVEVTPEHFATLPEAEKKLHIMIGESPRTAPENPTWHAVVGSGGKMMWDVNPSRVGLTKVCGYGLLVPTPPEWRVTWAGAVCVCPDCVEQKTAAA